MKRYDSYKDSGVEWIGEIPSHWDVTRIKYQYQIGRGRVISNEDLVDNGIYPVYSSQTLNNGCLGFIDTYDFDDKLITWTTDGANAGTVFLREGKFNCTNVCGTLKAKSDEIIPEFYYYFLQYATQFYKRPDTNGAKIMNNEMAVILSLKLSSDEQTAIANYLDQKTSEIDNLIAKKERLIHLLEEERTAIINQAVTKGLDPTVPMKDSGIEWLGKIPANWEVKKLKQIFNSSKGLTITKENLEDEGIPCVNYGEIHSKFGFEVDIDKHQLKCVNSSYLESDHKSLIQNGDFVFADTSEDVTGAGNFTYLKSNHEIFAGYHTIILRAFCDIEPRYFAYQFDSIPYRTQIRQSVKGIKVFSITQGILKNTSLWIPTLDEQKQIIKFLDIETDRIVSIKNSTRKEIELLKEYKTALISEVVTGKVDVRNENLN